MIRLPFCLIAEDFNWGRQQDNDPEVHDVETFLE